MYNSNLERRCRSYKGREEMTFYEWYEKLYHLATEHELEVLLFKPTDDRIIEYMEDFDEGISPKEVLDDLVRICREASENVKNMDKDVE